MRQHRSKRAVLYVSAMGAVLCTMGLVFLARPRASQLPPPPQVAVTPGRIEVREIPTPGEEPSRKPRAGAPSTFEAGPVVVPPLPPPIVEDGGPLKKAYSTGGLTLTTIAGSMTLVLSDLRFGGRPLPPGLLAGGVSPAKSPTNPDEVVYERGAVVEK